MSNNLGVSDYIIGGMYDTWGDAYVADMAILNKMAGAAYVIPDTGGTVTLDVVAMQNFALQATGGTATQLDVRVVDGLSRFWWAKNDRASGVMTIRCAAGGTAVTLQAGDRRLVYSDGTNVVDLTMLSLAISSVTGLQAALDAKAAASAVTGLAALAGATFTGPVVLAADPSSALHAATKQYVDSLAANVGRRGRVRVLDTTDSDPATSGYTNGTTIDGVTVATGDLILRNSASHTSRNGVWAVVASGGAARFSEFDTWAELPGSLLAVEEGTTGADTLWLCTSNLGGTLDTTAVLFSQVMIAPASTTISGAVRLATNTETITGTDATIAVTPAGLGNMGVARLGVAAQVITGGANVTIKDLGALSAAGSNTITPNPGDRPIQKITNDHAGSILPGSNLGQYSLEVLNTTGAGAITTTGWTLKGDSFDTATTSQFLCSCFVGDVKVMIITKVA